MEELDLQNINSTEKSQDKQEMYTKMALLMFYPYQKLNNLTVDGSYWKKNHKQFQNHLLKKILEKRASKYFKILMTDQSYKNMSNVLETQF